MFDWSLIARNALLIVLPLVLGFWLVDRFSGEMMVNKIILGLAAAMPFYALGWIVFQHFRPRKR